MTWQQKAREILQKSADECFSNWCKTKDGEKWRKSQYNGKPKSPYSLGYTRPDWHDELIEALNEDNEEVAKYIILTQYY